MPHLLGLEIWTVYGEEEGIGPVELRKEKLRIIIFEGERSREVKRIRENI